MSLLGRNENPVPDMPTPQDIANAQAMQYNDPLAAAQLSRMYEPDSAAVGVAQITVDNRRAIEEFKARLRGKRLEPQFNMQTGEELPPKEIGMGEPLMNEEGINHLAGLLESALSKNIMLSNIPLKDHKHILQISRVFWRTIALQIAINSEKWSVDRSRRDSIPMELSLLLYTNFMRAYDDGERRKLYPGQRAITTQVLQPQGYTQEKRQLLNF